MPQITYTTQGGDTLPSIAEACGHPGEWTAILESAQFEEGVDVASLPPGSEIVLPPDWSPGAAAEEQLGEAEEQLGAAPTSSMSAAELIGMAQAAESVEQLEAIRAAAAGRITVLDAVADRGAQLGEP